MGVPQHSEAITVPKCLPYCAALYFNKSERICTNSVLKIYISSMLKLFAMALLYATVLWAVMKTFLETAAADNTVTFLAKARGDLQCLEA